jgi:hypothetical protein
MKLTYSSCLILDNEVDLSGTTSTPYGDLLDATKEKRKERRRGGVVGLVSADIAFRGGGGGGGGGRGGEEA